MKNQTKPPAQVTNTFFFVNPGQYVMHSEDLKYDSDKAMRVRFFGGLASVHIAAHSGSWNRCFVSDRLFLENFQTPLSSQGGKQ